MLQCYNNGCGKLYDAENNEDSSCCFHPGVPVFHDTYKGWSCCNKKSVDFTEFLDIRGCSVGKHSNVKPVLPKKAQNIDTEKSKVVEVRAPISKSMNRPSTKSALVSIEPCVASSLKQAIDEFKDNSSIELTEQVIAVGALCKNSGCTYSFTGTKADDYECCYHHGSPIFHEGLKYWSCCQKRTTDFNVFMEQKGCTYGAHNFAIKNDKNEAIECRYDWHQTASDVVVTIYAKMYHYKNSSIEVNPVRLHVNLVFPQKYNSSFDLDLELHGVIRCEKTVAQMYGTKVEIIMPKAASGFWSKLSIAPIEKTESTKLENNCLKRENSKSSSEGSFDLDDVETYKTGALITEIESEENNF